MFVLSIVLSWSQSGVPLLRGLFGQFGRGNGLFYYFFVLLIFVFSIKTFKTSNSQKMHQLITILSWFLSIYATFQNFGIDIAKLNTQDLSPVVLTFGNSNFAGGMLAVLFSYHFIYSLVKKQGSFKEGTLLVALLVSSTFTAAVQGYLIILFSIAIGISIWITQMCKTPIVSKLLIGGWILGIVAIILGLFGKFIFAPIFARSSFQIRIEYWRITLAIIRDYPLFGIGPDKLYDVTPEYMSPGSLKLITSTRMDNAHNWFLNLGANFGLISLGLLSVLFGCVFYASTMLLKSQNLSNPVSVSSAIAFVAMFLDGLVSIEQPGLGIWLYFFAGVTIASRRELSESSIQANSRSRQFPIINRSILRTVNITLLVGLLGSSLAISYRIYFDGVLRSNVQSALLYNGTTQTISNIETATIKLKSEPEYSVQGLRSIAALGDAVKLDSISKAVYEYDPNSIQASLIRADVLRALNRNTDGCPIYGRLLINTPWSKVALENYLWCSLDGYVYPNIEKDLKFVEQFITKVDQSAIPSDSSEASNISSRLNSVAFQARLYLIVGQVQLASDLQAYGSNLLERLTELQSSNPSLVTESQLIKFRKLLDF
jgi:hypothetical protein